MAENKSFEDYYQDIRVRDQKRLEDKPMPQGDRNNVSSILGLAVGISGIAFSIITKYSIILAIVGGILSVFGYVKKKRNVGLAGIICSSIGLILGIVFAVLKFEIFQVINL